MATPTLARVGNRKEHFVRRTIAFAVFFCTASAVRCWGADDFFTNSAIRFSASLRTVPQRGDFSEAFTASLQEYVPVMFEDRLHPLKVVRLLESFQDDPTGFRDANDDAALGALSKALSYSAREAFTTSPLVYWFRGRGEEAEEALLRFLQGSIGRVEEDEVRADDISYRVTGDRWWQRLSKTGIQYGVKPFRTDPYAFLSIPVGSRRKPLMLVNTRYRLDGFREHRVEAVCSFRALQDFALDVGTLYRFRQCDVNPNFTLKFSRKLGRGMIFLGVDLRRDCKLLTGITMPM